MNSLINRLKSYRTLDDAGLREILGFEDISDISALHECAMEISENVFGKKVYLRGLVEWSNVCRNDCYYCGIRRSNSALRRYVLSREEIMESCDKAFRLGLRTFVLQGGENPAAAKGLAGTIAEIRASWPGCAITLSLGELPFETYALLRRSGADRFLLRHETADANHYSRLHPAGMRLESRLACLKELRSLGFQTGMGMMIGSPFQTLDNIIADIRLIEKFKPEMIGAGPFIPQRDTPFANCPAGSTELTLRIYSILRIMFPKALIPSTTALSTLRSDGRTAGILAGANVIMPNFTPCPQRSEYSLYEGKNSDMDDCTAKLAQIETELASIGWSISGSRGDYGETSSGTSA